MKLFRLSAISVAVLLSVSSSCIAQTPQVRLEPKSGSAATQISRFLELPLDFEVNNGQASTENAFVAHGPSYGLGISSSGLTLALHRSNTENSKILSSTVGAGAVESAAVCLNLVGASKEAQVTGLDLESGKSNYFIGNTPANWKTDIAHFSRVKVSGTYPGIDLIFYGKQQQLEYDFSVAPKADPNLIRFRVEGVRSLKLDTEGNAVISTAVGDVQLKHPVAYQLVDGVHKPVESRFEIAGNRELKFVLGSYDREAPLVIDPVLKYGVEIGGSNGTEAMGLAVDSLGNAYVSGFTCSADFPSTAGKFASMPTNATQLHDCDSAVVFKMDPTASTLIYSDFIGGTKGFSAAGHLAVDGTGNAFVTGATGAVDFPTVSNIGPTAPQTCGIESPGEYCPTGFILKLSPDGSQLLFSSLLGGSQATLAVQTKINPATGDVVVLGNTNSASFLPAPTTLDTTFGGGSCFNSTPCFNGFLLGLDPQNGTLRYGAFIGGASDWGAGLGFDGTGNIYVSGSAKLPFATSIGSVTHTYVPAGGATATGATAYVVKFNLSANQLSPGYLTLLQGDGDTTADGIAIDTSGNLYFSGATAAKHLPVTTGAFQSTNNSTYGNSCLWPKLAQPYLPNPCGTGLVGKLDNTGSLSFLTYLGGTGQDVAQAINIDSGGNLWIGGVTSSQDFPFSADHYGVTSYSFYTPFLAEMSNDGAHLPFATLIGLSSGMVSDLVVDGGNNVYVAGFAGSALTTPGTYPVNPNAFTPLFVQKWSPGLAPTISVSTSGLTFGPVALGASSATQTVTVQNTSTVAMELGVQLTATYGGETPSDFPESTTCGASLAAGASCTITVAFAPGPPSQLCVNTQNCDPTQRSAEIFISNNATQGQQHVGLSGQVTVGSAFYVSPNPITFPAQQAGTTSAQLYVNGGSTGDTPVLVSSMVLSGPNASDFQLQTTGAGLNCLNNSLSPGTYCSFFVTFSPPANATGTRTATLTFTDNSGDSPQVVPVSGVVSSANFLNISPVALSMSYPAAIGTSTTAVLNLQNPSTSASVQVTGLGISGTNAGDFSVSSVSCGTSGALPGTIAPGATCIVQVAFTPTAGASGLRSATLTVQTTPAATGLPTVALSGQAVTNSDPSIGIFKVPDPLNFGGLQVGETSNNASVLFNVSNKYSIPCAGGASTCGAPLIVTSITPGLSDYTVAGQGPACTPFPVTVPVGGGCTFNVVFKPTQSGSRNTTLTIQSNDPQGAIQVPIFGTGLSIPLAEVLGSALDFGNSAIGVASPALTTTLKNVGQVNLTFNSVTPSANFAVSANTCTGSLAPSATCSVSVTFTPPAAGNYAGTLTISDNDGLSSNQIVTLAGTGATGPQLRIRPQSLDLGKQAVGGTSAAQTITLTSTGDSAVTFPTNALQASQLFILQSTTCGSSLPAQVSCTASVQYKPFAAYGTPDYGSLLITDNVIGSPQPVYLQGTATPSTTPASTTKLVSSVNPSNSGQLVTFTATVTGPTGNATVPTGSVSFVEGDITLGTSPLNGAGVATYATSALGAGSIPIEAVYSGDSNFQGSMSSTLTQTVNPSNKAATSAVVQSSLNPSASGQQVTFTATVTGPTGNPTIPTGTVNFLDGSTTLGSGTLNGAGMATYSTTSLSAASHSITAVYGGDSSFNGATSPILTQVVNPAAKATSTTAVASSVNPSSSGQSVTITATVTGPSGNSTIPTGSVNFLDGSTTLGSGTLNGSGIATYNSSSLATGSHAITAVYAGDSNFNGSTSSPLNQVVNPPALLTSTTAVASSLNPSGQSQSVTFTATVTGPTGNATIPTGTITFKDGASTLGTGSLNGTGQATFASTSLSAGAHSITAVYGGDSIFAGSTSTALTQTVNGPSYTVSFNPSTVTITAGNSATTTITVTPTNGFNQQVTFACSGLPAASTCTFSPSTLTPTGTNAVTATLTIATNVASASMVRPLPFTHHESTQPYKVLVALVLLGIGGLARSRRNSKRTWTQWMLVLAFMATLGFAVSACGGGSNGGGGGGGGSKTPTGSSTISVQVSSGSQNQSANFTLIVQ